MKPARLRRILPLLGLLLLAPRAAWADDCSGLIDCWDQILTALMVLAAIALFIAIGWELLAGTLFTEGAVLGAEALEIEAAEAGLAEEATVESELAEETVENESADVTSEISDPARNARTRYASGKLPEGWQDINVDKGETNCVPCARAFEERSMGVKAFAADTGPVPTTEWTGWYGRPLASTSSAGEIESVMQLMGDGARGIIRVASSDSSLGHVLNVVNVGGEIIYVDAQAGIASTLASDVISATREIVGLLITFP